jgi:hypothetical protein
VTLSSSKIPHPSHKHFPGRVPFSKGKKKSQEMHCMLIRKNTLQARLVVKTHPTTISIAMLAYHPFFQTIRGIMKHVSYVLYIQDVQMKGI